MESRRTSLSDPPRADPSSLCLSGDLISSTRPAALFDLYDRLRLSVPVSTRLHRLRRYRLAFTLDDLLTALTSPPSPPAPTPRHS
eukprot:CAMPEP_0174893128 /NCGR_PEP_ID=MMETSP0167-20121228/7965_1 /TAXON_ID=38298 /ORGANISM="Rhodella maculata, Strain CCMP736" /LENGTH=84 /DNA_ID=CAMNT_0016131821 /DNA_START=8 /DNA_END=258 /DNA_ORIENTATION=-